MRAVNELRRLEEIEVIHTPEYLSGAVIASLLPATPLVFTEPGNIYERVAKGNPYDFATTQVFKVAARVCARRCAQCIATSETMRRWWLWTGVPPSRLTQIPLGIETRVFHRIPNARAELGLDRNENSILFAARLSPENGLGVTLRAVATLSTDLPDVHLHVLGTGPDTDRLKAEANRVGVGEITTWHGWVDYLDLPRWYSAADVFAFSGFSGGTPRVMLQAMACGTPIVASAIGGIVDHIDHAKKGLLFKSGSSDNMAEQLKRALTDKTLADHMAAEAHKYVLTNLTWTSLVPLLRDVYSKVVGS
jgi:D-inositol-3-phosphate glycosyltransferase